MPSSCVCLFVCLSDTLQYCIKTAKRRITQIMPHDSRDSSFQMGCFVVAEFLLTSASCSRSAIAEPLVLSVVAASWSKKSAVAAKGGGLWVYLVQRTTSVMLRYLSICWACNTRQVLVLRRTVPLHCNASCSQKFIALWQCFIRKYWDF